jgi:photosystem II stability/assembly factor-like uncharacterized protein
MTLRPRLFLPVLALSFFALMALAVAPSVARADTLTWAAPQYGPADTPNGEAEPIPVASALNAVSFADATHGWAVGLRVDNVILNGGTPSAFFEFTSDGGASWTPTTLAIAGTAELYGVVARSASDVWAVGDAGTIVHFNGISWDKKPVADWTAGKALRAIAFSGSNGWAVGDGCGVAFTSDNGANWTTLIPPGASGTLRAVAAVGSGAYAVGDSGTGSGSAMMKRLDVDGSWPASPGTGNALYGISFADAAHGWAVGANATFIHTSDGGSTWTSITDTPIPLLPGTLPASNGLRSIAFADASNGIAVGRYQGVWRTSDGGSSWIVEQIVDGGLGDFDLRGVAFVPGSADHPVVVARHAPLSSRDDKSRSYRGTWTLPLTRTLTYTAGVGGTISGTVIQTVPYGGSGTAVTAVPNTGYHFVSWSDGSTTAARTDSGVVANIAVSATFAVDTIDTYTLTYTAGAGGTIAGASPQTVALGGNGTLVTAVPNTGYHFVSWSDGSTTAARTDTNVTGNLSVTANFAINSYALTYTAGSGGTISGTAIQTVPYGGSGTAVTAVPNTGYHFVSWSDGSTTAARTDTNVTGNLSVTANFAVTAPDTRTLTYTAGVGGTIAGASPQTVALGGNGTLVTAVPSTGYHFVSWSDGSTTAARTDTNVTGNLSVTANFAINSYALTYTAGVGGTISGTVIQTVPYGGSGTAVTAVPSTGYHFVTWSDGVTTVARTDSGIVGNVTASATFAANTYQLHYTAGTGGTLGGTINQTVPYGGSGTAVTAVPNTGYHFVGWSDGLLTAARTDSSVAANITVAAVFAVTAPDTRTLTYTAGVGGTIVGTSPQTVSVDGNGTLVTAVPNTGYHFVSWSDGSTIAARTDTVVKADLLVSAVFAVNTYTLTYAAGSGGTISGTVIQTVPYGGSGTAVTAVPSTGYHFVRWSDGSTTAARTDSGVVANIAVSATFAVDTIGTYTLTYTAGAGGTISGTSPQTVAAGSSGMTVTAVPNIGYRFVSWSDGVTTPARADTDVSADRAVIATFASASVATKLTMNASPTRLSPGHSAHFYGVMAPNMPNSTPIALLVRKAGQTKWTRVGSYVRTYNSHHWSRYYHPNTRGTYYFKVRFSATAAYAGTTSRTVTVVWR